MYWLIECNSSLSIHNNLIFYKQILLKPVWTYRICNKLIIQRLQKKVLKNIVDAPWYIKYVDLKIESVDSEYAKSHNEKLHNHVDVEIIQLLNIVGLKRRLERVKLFELDSVMYNCKSIANVAPSKH